MALVGGNGAGQVDAREEAAPAFLPPAPSRPPLPHNPEEPVNEHLIVGRPCRIGRIKGPTAYPRQFRPRQNRRRFRRCDPRGHGTAAARPVVGLAHPFMGLAKNHMTRVDPMGWTPHELRDAAAVQVRRCKVPKKPRRWPVCGVEARAQRPSICRAKQQLVWPVTLTWRRRSGDRIGGQWCGGFCGGAEMLQRISPVPATPDATAPRRMAFLHY